jgi:heptosyltransferase III
MPGRILVIRGGAIGDFILTLPAIGLLRANFPGCHIEILGYRHIVSLAERRYYADATRSIEYGPLAKFFNPKSDLDPELSTYFASFNQVISYVYDPDELFATSLAKAGVRNLIAAPPKVEGTTHAACQLAAPLEKLALWLDDPAARFFPSEEDLTQARSILPDNGKPLIALHIGSGSETKNWLLENWLTLIRELDSLTPHAHFVFVSGESDGERMKSLLPVLPRERFTQAENLRLPVLGAIFTYCKFYIGHDTGVSHLAAAAGIPCLLLFGPTDPDVWAPANPGVQVVKAPQGNLSALDVAVVLAKVKERLAHVL